MPKKPSKIDFSSHKAAVAASPDDFFSAEETDRRMKELMRRMTGKPPTFDMATGQNYGEPKLSEDELKERGYPIKAFWDRE